MRRVTYRIVRLERDVNGRLIESYGGSYGSEEKANRVCNWYDRLAWFHRFEFVCVEEVVL